MALNPNHTFEEVGEVKCAIVEKNCQPARMEFLKGLLELNGFKVEVMKTPPPKAAKPAPKPVVAPTDNAEGAATSAPVEAIATVLPPDTYTVGVTDLTFNPTNAVFYRDLKTKSGKVVTPAVWKQLEEEPKEEEWYWKR